MKDSDVDLLEQKLERAQEEVALTLKRNLELEKQVLASSEELEKNNRLIIGEVRERLANIEAKHIDRLAHVEEMESAMSVLEEADREFTESLREAISNNRKFKDAMSGYDPPWAFTTGEDLIEKWADALDSLEQRNKKLEEEIETLREDRN